MEEKKIASNKILWIFAVGQLGWALLSGIISNWMIFFYQPSSVELEKGQVQFLPEVTILGLTIIGLISALGRVFDAVTDPFIAGKSDRCRHKLGRRIPFMRFAAVPFGLVTFLLFCSPVNGTSGVNAGALFVCAMLFYFCMTCYCTPYNALIPELGRTQETRINLSTFISVTFFFGQAFAYLVPNVAGLFESSLGYAGSFRLTVGIFSAIAVVCMLVPAFLIDEHVYADTKPSEVSAFSSLAATFRNKDFRVFVASDILYWIALTLFQTGLSFYITVLMGLSSKYSFPLFAVMTVMSLVFYAPVNIYAKKLGKKKLISFAFMFFAVTFLFTASAGIIPIPGLVHGIIVAVLAAVPMAILGILPQAVVADISEADKNITGESRSGMFYAARTFAFKLGQSVAMLVFTSVALINKDVAQGQSGYGLGYRLTAVIATVLCLAGGFVFFKYNENKVISEIAAGEGSADGAEKEEK